MNTAKIKSFEVIGLFGTHDVSIPFDSDTKILIGENGVGKTQVLNLLYYVLTKDFFKLSEHKFEEITLHFNERVSIVIDKEKIDDTFSRVYNDWSVKDVIDRIGKLKFLALRENFLRDKRNEYLFHSEIVPSSVIKRAIERFETLRNEDGENYFSKCESKIKKQLQDVEVLYFPTYRRVEEDLYNLGYNEEELEVEEESNLIQFGMDDVKRRFEDIQVTIDELLKEGLAQFAKDILTVVLDESEPDKEILDRIDENDLELILARVGSQISDAQKKAIKNVVANNEIRNPLSAYLLQKLVEIYEKQKELDNSVKLFRNVCNKYLINKKVFYDESAIEIYIKSEITGEPIDLKHLSSGEKQIISMFSKVYLSDSDQKFMILFDEPELSLSMKWQKQLLPDLMDSNKCEFLLAVTHSPFIFDNKLDQYAVGINEYISFTETAPQA